MVKLQVDHQNGVNVMYQLYKMIHYVYVLSVKFDLKGQIYRLLFCCQKMICYLSEN